MLGEPSVLDCGACPVGHTVGPMAVGRRRFFAASLQRKKPQTSKQTKPNRKKEDLSAVTTVKFCENMLQPYLKFLVVVVVDM